MLYEELVLKTSVRHSARCLPVSESPLLPSKGFSACLISWITNQFETI